MANGFYYDVNNNDMPTVIFLLLFGFIFILTTFVMIRVSKGTVEQNTLAWIIFFALVFRIVLVPGELIHENDIYRYIWDGKTTLNKINPYKYAPIDVAVYDQNNWNMYDDDTDEYELDEKRNTQQDLFNLEILHELRGFKPVFYERIGHWEVPTIYPPIAQLLFIIPVLINGYSLVMMKSFIVLFDIANIFIIIALLNHFKKNPCMSIVYAWSPLVLFEIANRGHYDAIPIFFTLLSILLLFKKKRVSGVYVLALATLSKFFFSCPFSDYC